MKKVAIASDENMTLQHFGHCESFNIFEVDNKEIVKSMVINNPQFGCGILPDFLSGLGVDVIICASIGERPFNDLTNKNIKVITGICGLVQSAIESYINGTIETTGVFCQGHQHHGCNDNQYK